MSTAQQRQPETEVVPQLGSVQESQQVWLPHRKAREWFGDSASISSLHLSGGSATCQIPLKCPATHNSYP